MNSKSLFTAKAIAGVVAATAGISAAHAAQKPNILAIWGDDIGWSNVSAYNMGMMGYKTKNIDRIANEGAIFTDMYAQNSSTAGRASFILGQEPFRTGLLTIGMPGSDQGIKNWMPTMADALKDQGYATGQFGKNHLGDRDYMLPTNHGFDEFYGYLYHLNAQEEPETYYYPKDPAFKKKYGPRGVIHSYADGRIEDTGQLTRKRMETIDNEDLAKTVKFMTAAVKKNQPFFIWYNSSRMHIWTHLAKKWQGKSGISITGDGMLDLDHQVGVLLDTLDKLKVADNTIVIFSTDNGAEKVTWPDGGSTPFAGEKGTTKEGGMRVPQVVRWPGTIKPGTKINGMMDQMDWFPTLLAAAGNDHVKKDLASKNGTTLNGKKFRVHLDGFNFKPFFEGKVSKSPRNEKLYFSADGMLNAVRWGDWKITFANENGAINEAVRTTPAWPGIQNLRADPFQSGAKDSGMYIRWYADLMWLFVPVKGVISDFFATVPGYPHQSGSGLSNGNIGYNTLAKAGAAQQLKALNARMTAVEKAVK